MSNVQVVDVATLTTVHDVVTLPAAADCGFTYMVDGLPAPEVILIWWDTDPAPFDAALQGAGYLPNRGSGWYTNETTQQGIEFTPGGDRVFPPVGGLTAPAELTENAALMHFADI